MRPPIPFYWDKLHHLYIGIFLTIIGFYCKNKIIMYLGIFGIADDVVEHTITGDTPVRIIFERYIKDRIPPCLISCPEGTDKVTLSSVS